MHFRIGVATLATFVAVPALLFAQARVEVLYAFVPSPGTPAGGVVEAPDGNLYGTTYGGGFFDLGTVYRLDRLGQDRWSLRVLHHFSGPEGQNPYAGLVEGSDGALYGTTRLGGNAGRGVVFRIAPNGGLQRLHSFQGGDGKEPLGILTQGRDGNFYGTTLLGGTNDRGTVVKMTPGGAVASLHSFAFTDGAYPVAGLVQGEVGR